ncbi:MAG: radical SAM protein [Desulfurococcaceae archaeon]
MDKALSKTSLPGLNYALNPYIGCSHGCIYCYAKLYTNINDVYMNWGSVVYVKKNLLNKLLNETKSLERGSVGIGTITDAYQPIEAYFKLTRKSIEILLSRGFEISIQTKNPLVLRDAQILVKHRDRVNVGFTITTISTRKSTYIEPKAPPPFCRINALIKLNTMGLNTWVFYGPVIPGFNDDDETMSRIMELCLETGSTLYVDPLRIKPFMLNENYPLHSYVSQASSKYWLNSLLEKIRKKCLEMGIHCRSGFEETPLD